MPYYVIPVLAGLALGYEVGYGAIVFVILEVLVAIALKPRGPQPGAALSGAQLVEYAGTVEPRRIIYGEVWTSGLNAIPPWCSGSSNECLHQCIVVAGHDRSALDDVA